MTAKPDAQAPDLNAADWHDLVSVHGARVINLKDARLPVTEEHV